MASSSFPDRPGAQLIDVIECWTDGSGPSKKAVKGKEVRGTGGWAALMFLVGNPFVHEISGAVENTTSSRMEITAVLKALHHIQRPSTFLMHVDSAYVVNACRQNWFAKWQRNGWVNSKGKPVANQDLWRELMEAIEWHEAVTFVKVKGHSGLQHNHRVDRLADAAKRAHLTRPLK